MAHTSPDAAARGKRGLGKIFRRGAAPAEPVRLPTPDLALRDRETGLPSRLELDVVLRREIARASRYGRVSCLAVFDVRIASYQPTLNQPVPPSPAKFVAGQLLDAAREADVVARVALTRFAVLLVECDERGASNFVQRTRTRISTQYYARTEDNLPIFVRSWAGYVRWRPEFSEPDVYYRAAEAKLEATFLGYEAAQSFFLAD